MIDGCTLLDDWITGDAFSVEGQFDLIIADPPYGKIVKQAWDNVDGFDMYCRVEEKIKTILKPGGTAYVWGGIGKRGDRGFIRWLGQSAMVYDVITWAKSAPTGCQIDIYSRAKSVQCWSMGQNQKRLTFLYWERSEGTMDTIQNTRPSRNLNAGQTYGQTSLK